MKKNITVSEYVSYCHPDKLADRISGAVADAYIEGDAKSRCGIETMVKDNIVVLGGEVCSDAQVNHGEVVREVFRNSPYPDDHHLNAENIKVINLIGQQSKEIHMGVDNDVEQGAGDQGMMLGYATDETPTYMPLQMYIAKKVCEWVCGLPNIGCDTKTQVVIDRTGFEPKVKQILVSTMHQCGFDLMKSRVSVGIKHNMIGLHPDIFDRYMKAREYELLINPCGEWYTGGSVADCGITGRKIAVDNYGSACPIGGGAFSGKDSSKVDLSGAWMARYIAKNIVAAGLFHTVQVELSYAIGVPEPTSVCIYTDEMNGKCHISELTQWIRENVDMRPRAIIERFHGEFPRGYYCATHGHFGLSDEEMQNSLAQRIYPWEKTDLANDLRNAFKETGQWK